jgi:hypothetical protein
MLSRTVTTVAQPLHDASGYPEKVRPIPFARASDLAGVDILTEGVPEL